MKEARAPSAIATPIEAARLGCRERLAGVAVALPTISLARAR